MEIAIVAFTDKGEETLKRITKASSDKFHFYNKSSDELKLWLCEKFLSCNAIIFVGAIGIATRLISKLITTKDKDPAVIVIDEKGSFVIPILSGHIGGANALALSLAEKLDATPVITTATDIQNKFAVDVWSTENSCVILDISKIKHVSSSILKNQDVGFYSDFSVENALPTGLTDDLTKEIGVVVSFDENKSPFQTTLNVIPKIITIGVGCRRNTDFTEFEDFIMNTLVENKISIKAVKAIASIDLKKDEECLLKFSKKYNISFKTYSSEELNGVDGEFTASDFVKATTGTDNVCERSAILESGGSLLTKKASRNGMTTAIAVSKWGCKF